MALRHHSSLEIGCFMTRAVRFSATRRCLHCSALCGRAITTHTADLNHLSEAPSEAGSSAALQCFRDMHLPERCAQGGVRP